MNTKGNGRIYGGADHDRRGWHVEKKITLNQLIFLGIEAIIFIGAIAAFYAWLNQGIGNAADKAARAADRITVVAQDIESLDGEVSDVRSKAQEAYILARSNKKAVDELQARLTRRDEEVLRRLERIESLLLESKSRGQ